ncbi:uncharacterized protein LOC142326016 isoform X2 [Lycorma delicatula]|uniref:uncharacterized protein LOC142326016 isoform X2 n=1 Tax=Lycorma delicatula TaxID=130591 RepID=UPI003F516764
MNFLIFTIIYSICLDTIYTIELTAAESSVLKENLNGEIANIKNYFALGNKLRTEKINNDVDNTIHKSLTSHAFSRNYLPNSRKDFSTSDDYKHFLSDKTFITKNSAAIIPFYNEVGKIEHTAAISDIVNNAVTDKKFAENYVEKIQTNNGWGKEVKQKKITGKIPEKEDKNKIIHKTQNINIDDINDIKAGDLKENIKSYFKSTSLQELDNNKDELIKEKFINPYKQNDKIKSTILNNFKQDSVTLTSKTIPSVVKIKTENLQNIDISNKKNKILDFKEGVNTVSKLNSLHSSSQTENKEIQIKKDALNKHNVIKIDKETEKINKKLEKGMSSQTVKYNHLVNTNVPVKKFYFEKSPVTNKIKKTGIKNKISIMNNVNKYSKGLEICNDKINKEKIITAKKVLHHNLQTAVKKVKLNEVSHKFRSIKNINTNAITTKIPVTKSNLNQYFKTIKLPNKEITKRKIINAKNISSKKFKVAVNNLEQKKQFYTTEAGLGYYKILPKYLSKKKQLKNIKLEKSFQSINY